MTPEEVEQQADNAAHHRGVIAALKNPAVVNHQEGHLEYVGSGSRILLRKIYEVNCSECDRLGLTARGEGCFQDMRLEDFNLKQSDVWDDPCPDCGAYSVNLATLPEVDVGCRKCGWRAVTVNVIQVSPQVKRQLSLN